MLKMVTEEKYCFYYVRTIYKDSRASPLGHNLKADHTTEEKSLKICWPKSDIFVGYLDIFDCNYVSPRLLRI